MQAKSEAAMLRAWTRRYVQFVSQGVSLIGVGEGVSMTIRSWGKDQKIHIMVYEHSWCGAETFTTGDPPVSFPPDARGLGLCCEECVQMESDYPRRGLGFADVLLVLSVAAVIGAVALITHLI